MKGHVPSFLDPVINKEYWDKLYFARLHLDFIDRMPKQEYLKIRERLNELRKMAESGELEVGCWSKVDPCLDIEDLRNTFLMNNPEENLFEEMVDFEDCDDILSDIENLMEE